LIIVARLLRHKKRRMGDMNPDPPLF